MGPGGNDGQDYWPINASGPGEGGTYVGYRVDGTQELIDIIESDNGWFMSATVKVTSPGPNTTVNEPFFGLTRSEQLVAAFHDRHGR